VELRGAVALVTGGAAGLGRFVAERLVAGGASVVVADVDEAAGAQATREMGSDVAFVRTDMRVAGDVGRMIDFAVDRFGGLDVLVNNAGGVGATAFPQARAAEWGAILYLNLTGPMLATQLALEPMRARGGGAVINVASSAGLGLAPYDSPEYGAAKAGLIRFTSTLAGLHEQMNVRVNCVVPDWIGLDRAKAELAAMTPEERAAAPPLVDPADIAKTVLDLACDESLAGRVVVMRGGEPARLLRLDAES
jgi:NAD(P)-dependent dehydrogenase (short-subunit alcohol dehydrogenase family)